MEFPKMMYRAGGDEEIHGAKLRTLVVNDQDEQDAALADGWHLTTPKAIEADRAVRSGQNDHSLDVDDDTPPTRDEMKAKAAELGLTFAHNISNVKLAELIEQALAKG